MINHRCKIRMQSKRHKNRRREFISGYGDGVDDAMKEERKLRKAASTSFPLAVLLLLLSLPTTFGIEPLCKRCDVPFITFEIHGSQWPGRVNITASLYIVQMPEERDPGKLVESLKAGEIKLDTLRDIAAVNPRAGENITILFNSSAGEQQICRKETDSNGTIQCEANIGIAGCGTFIARFESSTPTLMSTETARPYCVGGEIPFGVAINATECLTLFLILGLLAAALYASGKAPFAALDITTPKRPSAGGYWPGYLHIKQKMPPILVGARARFLKWRLAKALAGVGLGAKVKQLERIPKGKARDDALIKLASEQMPKMVKRVRLINDEVVKIRKKEAAAVSRKERKELARMRKELERERRKYELLRKVHSKLLRYVEYSPMMKPFPVKLPVEDLAKLVELSRKNPELHAWLYPSLELRPEMLQKLKEWAEEAKKTAAPFVKEGEDPILAMGRHMKEIASGEKPTAMKDELARLGLKLDEREKDIHALIDVFTPAFGAQWKLELARKGIEAAEAKGEDVATAKASVDTMAKEIDDMLRKMERDVVRTYSHIEQEELQIAEYLRPIVAIPPKAEVGRMGILEIAAKTAGAKLLGPEAEAVAKVGIAEPRQQPEEYIISGVSIWVPPVFRDRGDKAKELAEKVDYEKEALNKRCAKIIAVGAVEAAISTGAKLEELNLEYKRKFEREGAA